MTGNSGHLLDRSWRGIPPLAAGSHGDPRRLEVPAGRLATDAGRLLDAPEGPAQPAKCQNLLSFLRLVAVFILILAGIGIQSALTAFLRERDGTVAIIKTLGRVNATA